MSKRRSAAAASAPKREKLEPDTFGDKVVTLLHAIDDEEDQHIADKVPEITRGLSNILASIEDAVEDSEQSDAALHSLTRFTEALHQELVNEEIRRLERHLIKSSLFQDLMVSWIKVASLAPPKGEAKAALGKKLHDVHFELSKRGVEVLEEVLRILGEKPSEAAKEAAKAARSSAAADDDEKDEDEFDEDASEEGSDEEEEEPSDEGDDDDDE